MLLPIEVVVARAAAPSAPVPRWVLSTLASGEFPQEGCTSAHALGHRKDDGALLEAIQLCLCSRN
jgi:hypothetical protein